jgi:hypothetical protein
MGAVFNVTYLSVAATVMLHHTGCGVVSRWGAGRNGFEVYNRLSPANRLRVRAFYDIDPKKVGPTGAGVYVDCDSRRKIPVLHFQKAEPPVLLCVALDRTAGAFEANLKHLCDTHGWVEGVHYLHFT